MAQRLPTCALDLDVGCASRLKMICHEGLCKLRELERWSSRSIELDVASPADDIREHTRTGQQGWSSAGAVLV